MKLLALLLITSCIGRESISISHDMYVRTFGRGDITCERQRIITDVSKSHMCFYISEEWHCYERKSGIKFDDQARYIECLDWYDDKMMIRYMQDKEGLTIWISGKRSPNFLLTTRNICSQ